MPYKMSAPYQNGNIVGFNDPAHHDYEVRQGSFEVPSLEVANWFVENRGCKFVGVDINRLANARNIVVTRNQGLGDMLMMTPILRALRRDHPDAFITLATFDIFFEVFLHNPNVDRVVSSARFQKDSCSILEEDGSITLQDYWVECNGIAETSSEIGSKHRIDIFAEVAGYSGWNIQDRRLDYFLTQEEDAWAKTKLKELGMQPGDKLLAMAVTSTAANRNMPTTTFRAVADLAATSGWKVMILDRFPFNGWDGPGVINMAGKTNLREMAALLAQATMFFGPDTGSWHLASALNVPNVVYMGAINWKLRVSTPATRALVRSTACYPCDRYDCRWHDKHACIGFDPQWIWQNIDMYSREIAGLQGTGIPGPSLKVNYDERSHGHLTEREAVLNADLQQSTAYMPGRGLLVGSSGIQVAGSFVTAR